MSARKEFHSNYPLNMLDAMYTVCIAVEGWKLIMPDLPYPTVKGSKLFLMFTGASDSAVRTAFSREKKKDSLRFIKNKDEVLRFDMNELGHGLTRFYHSDKDEITGMTMAVFQFETSQNKARYALKEILKNFGFAMFTQNTYISKKVDHREVEAAADAIGLKDNLFLFDTELPKGTALKKVLELYRTDQLGKDFALFKKRLESYYQEAVEDEDFYNMALYTGAASHLYVRMKLPPLPEELFPGLKISREIIQTINEFFEENFERHIRFYLKQNGGEE